MTSRRRVPVGSIALVALIALASTAAVASGTGHADRPAVRPAPASAPNASGDVRLGRSVVDVTQAEATTLRVLLEDTRDATIVVGPGDGGYNVTITVTDGDGDGSVPLEFRTGSVGMQSTRFLPANDADEYATLNASPDPDGTVPVGDYPISVYAGHGVGGEPTDIGTLVVAEAGPPPDASIDRNGSAITLAPRSGQVIAGTADLPAGRNVTVQLRSTGESPFIRSAEATTGENGTFAARLDLAGIAPPANATAIVLVDGRRIAGPVEADVVARATPDRSTRQSPTADGPAGGTTTPGQPGFGVPLALIAVVALAVGRYR